jgi:hypothetical protein
MSFLREQMIALLPIARENLERYSSLEPYAIAFVGCEMSIKQLSWKNLRQRRRVQKDVRQWMERCNAESGIIIAESWIKLGPNLDPTRSLADDPESHECILITGASANKNVILLQTFEKKPDSTFRFGPPQWFGTDAGETMTDEWLGGVRWSERRSD